MKKLEIKRYSKNILSKTTLVSFSAIISFALISNNALAENLNKQPETININVKAKTQKFPHFWEKIFGSGFQGADDQSVAPKPHF